jgi:hypothetical protein
MTSEASSSWASLYQTCDFASPALETDTFSLSPEVVGHDAGPASQAHDSNILTTAPASSVEDAHFVTTVCDTSLGAMQEGVIPTDPDEFKQMVVKPLEATSLATPLQRCPWRVSASTASPHRYKRLAKQAVHQTPVIAVAQNLLMRKLGLLPKKEMGPEDFDKYTQLFLDGLTEEQTKIINELFMDYVPTPEPVEAMVGEV